MIGWIWDRSRMKKVNGVPLNRFVSAPPVRCTGFVVLPSGSLFHALRWLTFFHFLPHLSLMADSTPLYASRNRQPLNALGRLKEAGSLVLHHAKNHTGVGIVCAVAYFDPSVTALTLDILI